MEWEKIAEDGYSILRRIRIEGGWIYVYATGHANAMTFVPDNREAENEG